MQLPACLMVTGKGGVGKTTVAAALGRRLAAAGRHTLLLEFDPRESLHEALGVDPSGGATVTAAENLDLCHISPHEVVESWLLERSGGGMLARRVLNAPIFRHVVEAAPGLKELTVLRKVLQSARPKGSYDTVILDAPASGHGLSWLDAPGRLAETLEDGPIREEGESIGRALSDPKRFGVWLVTAPSSMATRESIEFSNELRKRTGRGPAQLVINELMPEPPAEAPGVPASFQRWRLERAAEVRGFIELLSGLTEGRNLLLPDLEMGRGTALTEAVTRELAALDSLS
jgi:anion-transporting  ArsA/GET3 family ATPase